MSILIFWCQWWTCYNNDLCSALVRSTAAMVVKSSISTQYKYVYAKTFFIFEGLCTFSIYKRIWIDMSKALSCSTERRLLWRTGQHLFFIHLSTHPYIFFLNLYFLKLKFHDNTTLYTYILGFCNFMQSTWNFL